MSDLKQKSMSELIAIYNEMNLNAPVTEFKNLAAARAAITALENKTMNTETTTTTVDGVTTHTSGVASSDPSKYSSTGKRGPNQGVGAFAKTLIGEGKNNADILAAVKEKFPDAKTTTSCIAFYRTALKKGPAKKAEPTVAELETQAAELAAKIEAARVKAVADAQAALETANAKAQAA